VSAETKVPAVVVFPAGQAWQAVPEAYFPTGQSEQSEISSWALPPTLSTLLPAGQDSHAAPPLENLPATQLPHVDPSVVSPVGQFLQSSTKLLPAADVFPGAHFSQAFPEAAYFPASQVMHSLLS